MKKIKMTLKKEEKKQELKRGRLRASGSERAR
jgi:hypothetical protein